MGTSGSTPKPALDGWDQYKEYAPGGEWESYGGPIPPPQRSEQAYRSKFVPTLRGYNCSALADTGCGLVPGDLDRTPTYWEAVKEAEKWSFVDHGLEIQMRAHRNQANWGDMQWASDSNDPLEAAYSMLRGTSKEAAQAAYIQLYREHNDRFCPKLSIPLDSLATLDLSELKRLAIEECGLTFQATKSLGADELRTRIAQDWDPSVRGAWNMKEELEEAFERYTMMTSAFHFDHSTHPRDPEPPLWFDMSDVQGILRHFDADREDRRMLTLVTGLRSDRDHPLHKWSREVGGNVLQQIADLVSEQRDAVRKRAVDCVDAAERSYLDAWAAYRYNLDQFHLHERAGECRMLGDVNGRSGFGLIGSLGWDGENLRMRE